MQATKKIQTMTNDELDEALSEAALGDLETAKKHRWAIRKIRRMSVDRVLEQS